jgi:hypothetical protein
MPIRSGLSRRRFLQVLGLCAGSLAAGLWGYDRFFKTKYAFTGSLVGANAKVGHLLRHGVAAEVTAEASAKKSAKTLIVGGGISGLSAAWWLKKNGYNDFVLLEMDTEVGGNSRSGKNAISAYPWGAHYVPLPGPDAHYVRELFQDLNVITGFTNGLPVYDEFYLCADPHERLFFQGQWHEGLVPQQGIQIEDKRQYTEFFSYIESLKIAKGQDGRAVFSIPLEQSSKDVNFLKLDQISMSDFMASKGWTSRYLNWYVNYSCRDDYGVSHSQVSAWAGLHYFASRAGVGANADSQTVITWPEGNGWLVSKLRELVSDHIQVNSLAYAIENHSSGCFVDVLNTQTQEAVRHSTEIVIYCGPRFTAKKVIKGYSDTSSGSLDFAPWLVANISLKKKPAGEGASLAWDNVSFYSPSLGYIVANHQELTVHAGQTVLTYYLPLSEGKTKEARLSAYQKTYEDWLNVIVPDLERMHPGITKDILNIDAWVWGHGMVSPGIDFLWSEKRQELLKPFGKVHFAHTDMSGISIFEEAQYRGVEAAKKILDGQKRHGGIA